MAAGQPIDVQPVGPWFRLRPGLAALVAATLFAGIFGLRLADGSVSDAITVLFVLPVALVAVAFGFRPGLGAGLLAVALMVVWVAVRDIDLTPLGWFSRVTPMLLLGALMGLASDRIHEAEERERELAAMAALQRESAEIQDTVVQGMAAAKWMLEMGEVDQGISVLTTTMCETQALVAHLLGSNSPLPAKVNGRHPAAHR